MIDHRLFKFLSHIMGCFSSSSSSREVSTSTIVAETSTLPDPFHPAHAISNIKTHIPISLDTKISYNYEKWSRYFNTTADRLSLTDLLNGKPRPPNISIEYWKRADSLLQYWIYSTISEDLSSMIFSKTASAHHLWTSLASLFLKSLKLGSLPVYDYCRAIKTAADNLASAGQPLSDEQLVLQTLRGLPKQFETFANLMSCQGPLPSFAEIDRLIELEEYRLNEKIFREFRELNDKFDERDQFMLLTEPSDENSTSEIDQSCEPVEFYVFQRQQYQF